MILHEYRCTDCGRMESIEYLSAMRESPLPSVYRACCLERESIYDRVFSVPAIGKVKGAGETPARTSR